MMAALAPADELMADAPGTPLGVWTPVSEPVSVKPCGDVAVLVRSRSLTSALTMLQSYPNPNSELLRPARQHCLVMTRAAR